MPKAADVQFLKLIHEVFDSVFTKYGFSIQDEEIWLQPETTVFARKDEIALEIKLSGNLGEKATSDSHYRDLGITAIS